MKGLLIAVGAMAGLAACASDAGSEDVTARLQAATAPVIAAQNAGAIQIADAERHPAKWEWRATYQGRTFACDADNQMRLPSCTAADES